MDGFWVTGLPQQLTGPIAALVYCRVSFINVSPNEPHYREDGGCHFQKVLTSNQDFLLLEAIDNATSKEVSV